MFLLRNMVFIVLLLTYLDSTPSEDGKGKRTIGSLQKCLRNIYTSYDYITKKPNKAREDIPLRAYLKKTVDDFDNDDAKFYFHHFYILLIHKEDMLLPEPYCYEQTAKLERRGMKEHESCVKSLKSMFLDEKDRTKLLKDAFWNFKDSSVNHLGIDDYRFRYFYYMGGKLDFPKTNFPRSPLTPKEFCLYGEKYRIVKKNQKRLLQSGEGTSSSNSVPTKVTRFEDLLTITSNIKS